MKISPKGFKRSLMALMMLAVPIVSAQPISILQENFYTPEIVKARIAKTSAKIGKSAWEKKIPVRFGIASWYSETDPGINRHTANGEIFNDSQLTCASWDFPFGTLLKVTNQTNGKSVVCRVNDRGPHKRLERLIDLTRTAFSRIASTRGGLIRVSVVPLPKS